MNNDVLITQLKKVGWSDFAPGEFLGVKFDTLGKAKVARNNWFVLLQSIPVLDAAGLDTWSKHYAHFSKRAPAGFFSAGKYFVLILLVDTVGADAAQRLSEGPSPGFFEIPEVIDRGGGYTIVVIKDHKKVLMPKKIVLWDIVRATDFLKRTHQAVVSYTNALSLPGGESEAKPTSGLGTVLTDHWDQGR